jgi:hypothetical protein
MYYSSSKPQKQEQKRPRLARKSIRFGERAVTECRNKHFGGSKCRNPKCSRECRARAAYRLFNAIESECKTKPDNTRYAYVTLTMPDNSSVDDHTDTRKAFFHSIRSHQKRHDDNLSIVLISHTTDYYSLHYDCLVCWTDGKPVNDIRTILVRMWCRRKLTKDEITDTSGKFAWVDGRDCRVSPREVKIERAARYITKARFQDKHVKFPAS